MIVFIFKESLFYNFQLTVNQYYYVDNFFCYASFHIYINAIFVLSNLYLNF